MSTIFKKLLCLFLIVIYTVIGFLGRAYLDKNFPPGSDVPFKLFLFYALAIFVVTLISFLIFSMMFDIESETFIVIAANLISEIILNYKCHCIVAAMVNFGFKIFPVVIGCSVGTLIGKFFRDRF